MMPMKHTMRTLFAAAAILPALAFAAAVPGQSAPDFSVEDAEGTVHTLADYRGEWLVLEWFNRDCPFVRKHYDTQNMQDLQARYTDEGVKWLTVISSNEGKQGYFTPEQARAEADQHALASSAAFLLDVSGDMGRAYDAKVTPHMYVIDPEGTVVYAGAIDDNDSANPAVVPESHNYVAAALDAGMSGDPVATTSTRAYGCTIKY